MRKLLPMLAVAVLFAGFAVVRGADEKTVTGEAQCAKCTLKETKSCQNAIKVKEGDKTVTYYVKHDSVAKGFHSKVCSPNTVLKVKAKGTVEEKDGKMILTASSIEVVEE